MNWCCTRNFPQAEKSAALICHSLPFIVHNEMPLAELTEGILQPKPEENFEISFDIFNKLSGETENDIEKLQIAFAFMQREDNIDKAKFMLDETYSPERWAMYEQLYQMRVGSDPLKAAPTDTLQ